MSPVIRPHNQGFSLIELLVVLAILSLLFTTVFSLLNSSQERARDAKRIADMKRIQLAVERYYDDYGHYPDTNGQIACFDCGSFYNTPIVNPAATDIRAALLPYLKTPPTDPLPWSSRGEAGYLYWGRRSSFQITSFWNPENMFNYPTSMSYNWWWCNSISASGQCVQHPLNTSVVNFAFLGAGICSDGFCNEWGDQCIGGRPTTYCQ